MPESLLHGLRVGGLRFRGIRVGGPAIPPGAQAIDAAWLSANATAFGGPPYVLNQAFGSYPVPAGGYYYLAADTTLALALT